MTMRPNPASSAGRAQKQARLARYDTPPAPWELALRPLGYLLVGLIWSALAVVTLALPLALPTGLLSDGPWTASAALADFDPVIAVLSVLLFTLVVAPLLGYAFIALPLATVPLAVLSFTYFARSLRPSYRGERLSATGWSREAIGPPTGLPTAMSLVPLRMTPWTRFWMVLYAMGWIPGRRLLVAALPAGIGYLLTVIWVLWPLRSPVAIGAWSVVSAAFAVATILLVVRDARLRFRSLGRPSEAGSARSARRG